MSSNREPLWFCHECHAEMRPLMVPDPVCASCHGSFVEKMENTADDPRQFAAGGDGLAEADAPPGVDAFLFSLQSLMDRGMGQRNGPFQRPNSGPSVTFELRSPTGLRTVRLGGANTLGGRNQEGSRPASPDDIPNLSSFVRPPPPLAPFGIPLDRSPGGGGGDRQSIGGTLMAQYLMALLGYHDPGMLGMPENGRMGDYVFNQEALDQIISQIMENSNAHRPVPASEEVIAKLPREVLTEGSPKLEQDCAVCKEQFKLKTEDPDEQIVVTLPCKHPFHQPCILPWLTSSGTCPVCRFQLVPQPEQHPTPPGSRPDADSARSRSPPLPPLGPPRTNTGSPGPSQPPHTPPSQTSGAGPGASGNSGNPSRSSEHGGLFHSIFSGLSGFTHPSQNNRENGNSSTNANPNIANTSGTNDNNNNNNGNNVHTGTRPWTPSWGGTSGMRPRSPRPTSPPRSSHQRTPPHRRSSSDPSSPHSPSSSPSYGRRNGPSSNSNNNNHNGNSNLPGGWADELD